MYKISYCKFTICIEASQIKIKVNGTKQIYRDICHVLQDIVHECCGNVHVGGRRGGLQHYDQLLKIVLVVLL